MPLPYQNASSGKNALEEIQKILRQYGCNKFATGEDFENGTLFIQFEHRGRMIAIDASARGYAAAWLKENPYNTRRKGSKAQHESKALEIGSVAVYSILRDWVKAQVTLIECGILSFDAAFLSHMMLPNGRKLHQEVVEKGLLPKPEDETP